MAPAGGFDTRRSMAALFPLAHRLWRTLPAEPRRRLYELATGALAPKAAWTPATPKTPQEPFLVAGPLSAPTGLGEAARLTLGGLVAAGRRVSAVDLSQPLGQRSVVSLAKLPSPAHGPGTLLLAVQPPSVAHALHLIGRRLIADKLRIGCWIWELDVLPDAWLPQVPLVHALAAPSLFVAEAFRRSFDRPVYLLRYPIGSAGPARGRRRTAGLPLQFGSALDMGSTAARKNPLAVLRAFRSAFGSPDPVRLTLKIRDEGADGTAMAQLRSLVEAPGPPVEIVTGDFPPERMEAWWDEIERLRLPPSLGRVRLASRRGDAARHPGHRHKLVRDGRVRDERDRLADFGGSRAGRRRDRPLRAARRDLGRCGSGRRRRGLQDGRGISGNGVAEGRSSGRADAKSLLARAVSRGSHRSLGMSIAWKAGGTAVGPKVVLLYWGRRGGGSVFTLRLAQELESAGEPVQVVCSLRQANIDLPRFEAAGIRYAALDLPHLSDRRKWLSLPRLLRRHADEIAGLRPNVVIITMNAPFAWPFVTLLRRRGLSVAYVAHDAEPHPGDYAAMWQRLTQNRLVRAADMVITLSPSVRERLTQKISSVAQKAHMIPVEAVWPIRRQTPIEPLLPDAPLRLLFYGRLLPYKGLHDLAAALEPLRSNLSWRLTIAGEGPLEPALRSLFAGWPQVDLELGWIGDERTAELFQQHHLLVCPYTEASQSGVVAEALSFAMPALVMPTGSLPEQVGMGRAGIVVEEATTPALAAALFRLIGDRDWLPDLSQRALQLMREHHDRREWLQFVGSARLASQATGR